MFEAEVLGKLVVFGLENLSSYSSSSNNDFLPVFFWVEALLITGIVGIDNVGLEINPVDFWVFPPKGLPKGLLLDPPNGLVFGGSLGISNGPSFFCLIAWLYLTPPWAKIGAFGRFDFFYLSA